MPDLIIAGKAAAEDWFGQHHYTGTASGFRFYELRNSKTLAMVGIGRGGNRYGVGDKFGLLDFKGNLEITRVACAPDAPRNTASMAISAVCRDLAAEGYEWLFSYSDTAQGHHGGIYQAVGATFVGTDARQWVNFELDGKRVSKRLVSGRFGHTRWPEVAVIAAERGHELRRVDWKPKLTYILNIAADRKRRRAITSILEGRALPYPKRDEDLTKMNTPYRNHRPKNA
jgi:hypothetical protein